MIRTASPPRPQHSGVIWPLFGPSGGPRARITVAAAGNVRTPGTQSGHFDTPQHSGVTTAVVRFRHMGWVQKRSGASLSPRDHMLEENPKSVAFLAFSRKVDTWRAQICCSFRPYAAALEFVINQLNVTLGSQISPPSIPNPGGPGAEIASKAILGFRPCALRRLRAENAEINLSGTAVAARRDLHTGSQGGFPPQMKHRAGHGARRFALNPCTGRADRGF